MKPAQGVVERLNKILTNELTAINQYFLHARMYKNWGLNTLGAITYKESIEEMKHADLLIERLLLLDGLPNMQDMHKLKIGEAVPECLAADLAVEYRGHETLIEAITHFESVKDYVSRDLAAHILEDTEEHIDFLETQIDLVEKLGLANYLQSATGDLAAG
jgi:bacterioferritin